MSVRAFVPRIESLVGSFCASDRTISFINFNLKTYLRRLVGWYRRRGYRGSSRLFSCSWRHLAPSGWIENLKIGDFQCQLDHRMRACRLMAYGIYEWQTICFCRTLIPPEGIVLDVGANVGYLTALFAYAVGPGGQVHIFEPAPACRPNLEFVLDHDDQSVITPNYVAVSDSIRKATFFQTEHILSHGYSRLDQRPSKMFADVKEYFVDVISLDHYIRERNLERIDLIKIDVEGHELQVLKGLQNTLERGLRPPLVIEATRGKAHDESLFNIESFLVNYGYRPHLPHSHLEMISCKELPVSYHGNLIWLTSSFVSTPTIPGGECILESPTRP